MNSPIRIIPSGITLSLHVQPGAAATGWSGRLGDALKLRVAARPIEGEANKELVRFLAEFFAVPRAAVTISRGQNGRHKLVAVAGEPARLVKLADKLL